MGATFYSSAALQGPKAYLFKENAGKLRDSTYGAVVLVSILVPICWIIVLLRVYTRTRLIKAFGGEDWAMLAALVRLTLHIQDRTSETDKIRHATLPVRAT